MNPLERRIEQLEAMLAQLVKSDRYTVSKAMQFTDGRNIQLGLSTGTKIGTASTQKLAFLGATPIAQAGAISAPSAPGSSYAQSDAQSAVAAINSLRTAIKNIGITA